MAIALLEPRSTLICEIESVMALYEQKSILEYPSRPPMADAESTIVLWRCSYHVISVLRT